MHLTVYLSIPVHAARAERHCSRYAGRLYATTERTKPPRVERRGARRHRSARDASSASGVAEAAAACCNALPTAARGLRLTLFPPTARRRSPGEIPDEAATDRGETFATAGYTAVLSCKACTGGGEGPDEKVPLPHGGEMGTAGAWPPQGTPPGDPRG